MLAWLFARRSGSGFLLRIEDLDRAACRDEHVRSQVDDLQALGIDWDGPIARQSERLDRYKSALARLDADGLLFSCYCSRREVRAAVAAPHGDQPEGTYPGTCHELTAAERAEREAAGRRPAWRVRAGSECVVVEDRLAGRYEGMVDDFVVRRADGTPAYQLAVVVDDADQGVGEVVRGDDLLASTPRQVWLARQLGLSVPTYAHVPLVLGPDGERLAKRHGAVTLDDLRTAGVEPSRLLAAMAESSGLEVAAEAQCSVRSVNDLVSTFDPGAVSRTPWTFDPRSLV